MHLTVVVPVKNETWTIPTPASVGGHRLTWVIVDDGSAVPHPQATVVQAPRGYGAALKTGIAHATTDWVATMDGDGQHDVVDVGRLADFAERFPEVVMVVGDRRLKEESLRRFLGRAGLNALASCLAGRWIPDLNSGLRLMRRRPVLAYCEILSDRFSFTTTSTLSLMADGCPVDFLPIRVAPRPSGTTHVRLWQDGWRTLGLILRNGLALRTRKLRALVRPLYARWRQ